MKPRFSRLPGLLCLALLTACGTTYSLATVGERAHADARAMFVQEQARPIPTGTPARQAAARFERVVARVCPVAVKFCEAQATGDKVCDLPIVLDEDMRVPNAYQTRSSQVQPYVAISIPILTTVRNDDELAFILSH